MTSKEAFEQWCIEFFGYHVTVPKSFYICWQAACEYQKQKDAEICKAEEARLDGQRDYAYAFGADICCDAILNQS